LKKILIVTRNFPPLWGGMERLNLHMAEELARVAEVRLVAPEGAEKHVTEALTVIPAPLKPLWRFLCTAGWKALREARAWKPDVVLAGSGLVAPLAFFAARACGAKAVASAHGLDMAAPHPVYRALWLPLMKRLDGLIANSRATRQLAENIGVAPQRITIVHPGVELSDADPGARRRFRVVHRLGEGPVLLSVGRLTTRKGLREFVSEVLPRVVLRFSDVQLVVIGDAPSDSLHAQIQSIDSILATAKNAGVEKNLRFLGKRFGAELSDAYAGADLHVFPVRHLPNDPEGFGMVAVEAAASGLATVAYATGGVVDAVSEGISGLLVEPGDVKGFAEAVCTLLRNPLSSVRIRCFAEQFAWSRFGEKLSRVLLGGHDEYFQRPQANATDTL
jgi:phosphatidylinositol alpha-1,6-mannosyltransferase